MGRGSVCDTTGTQLMNNKAETNKGLWPLLRKQDTLIQCVIPTSLVNKLQATTWTMWKKRKNKGTGLTQDKKPHAQNMHKYIPYPKL